MTTRRNLMGAAAFSLALAGGGVAGAVLATPGISGASDDEPTTETGEPGAPERRWQHRGELVSAAAEALGMTGDELRGELVEGASIAEVAQAQGVDVATVVEALVATATERLEEIEAALPERMAALVEREGMSERRGRHGGPGRPSPDAQADESAASG